ncbi:MBL fold metallo-hydrolase [Edaphobacillus lindanitolerans]|uniref:Hydroxyacylglutathione hydrolase n=1 Tax=Edaphobacillus lindanitolerans TaxID=550447 RepID=A0A1U7PL37_9BACI|nr:MBL fold metallo-hydrolase [Edaphobacillus lindanitolerans]SIT75880.1 hydroxyacylglutathione hydrolase [Edaphobacillus lindanitolerans]
MFFQSFFDEHLAQYAYLVGCQRTGEAIVIDPPRHSEAIISKAQKEGLKITAAAETHIHADFTSGARQLAHDLGATLYLSDEGGDDWRYTYTDAVDAVLLKDGDTFSIGNIEFAVLHTPGHTPESISYILTDKGGGANEPMGIFTGDFVFVGDVGRPDLLEKAAGIADTAEQGARQMFRSVKSFKALPDHLIVWPGHGAGSACGKSLGAVPLSTVGYEKQMNWAMKEDDEEAFVRRLLDGQPEAPSYFAMMKKVNKEGPELLGGGPVPLLESPERFNELRADEQTVVLDTRPAQIAEKALVKGSINIPFNKSFTNWAGWLIRYDEPLVLIAEEGKEDSVRKALESIHLDHIKAFVRPETALSGSETDTYVALSPDDFVREGKEDGVYVLDVRNDSEWASGRMPGAAHHFLGHLRTEQLPVDRRLLVHCQSGARSAIAASILKARGFSDVEHLAGGFNAYERAGHAIVK